MAVTFWMMEMASNNADGAVYLFTFDDTNFSNPTLTGTIGKGYAGNNDLDLSDLINNDRAWRVALDGDGDRLAFITIRATSGGVDSGSVYYSNI